MKITAEQYKLLSKKKKQNKYRNVKTEVDGIKFDSKAEARRYTELKLLEKAGKIKDLKLQPKYRLLDGFKKKGKSYRPIDYIADFSYFCTNLGHVVVEDVKGGALTDVFKIKQKLFEYSYPNLEITIVRY